jgi:hypothetical protein
MSRGLDSALAAALTQASVTHFVLVDMVLDSGTLRLATTPFDIDYGGNTYTAVYGIGAIEAITETSGEQRGLAFTLSGVPSSTVSLVLSENVQGRAVTVRLVVVDGATLRVDDAAWTGLLDTLQLQDGAPAATVRVAAEHRMIAWREPNLLRFSNEDQQRLNSGDKFFEYAADLAQATIVWPGKEFFQR